MSCAQQSRRHRSHAGRLHAAGFGALHERDALLEHLHGRVLQAGVGHALLLAGEARRDGLGVVIAIARVQEERLAGLALLAAPGAAADGLRRWLPLAGDGAVLSGVSLHEGALNHFGRRGEPLLRERAIKRAEIPSQYRVGRFRGRESSDARRIVDSTSPPAGEALNDWHCFLRIERMQANTKLRRAGRGPPRQ